MLPQYIFIFYTQLLVHTFIQYSVITLSHILLIKLQHIRYICRQCFHNYITYQIQDVVLAPKGLFPLHATHLEISTLVQCIWWSKNCHFPLKQIVFINKFHTKSFYWFFLQTLVFQCQSTKSTTCGLLGHFNLA